MEKQIEWETRPIDKSKCLYQGCESPIEFEVKELFGDGLTFCTCGKHKPSSPSLNRPSYKAEDWYLVTPLTLVQ